MSTTIDSITVYKNVEQKPLVNVQDKNLELFFENNLEEENFAQEEKIMELKAKLAKSKENLENAGKSGAFAGGLVGLITTFGVLGSNALNDSFIEEIGQKLIDKIKTTRNKNLATVGIGLLIGTTIMASCISFFMVLNNLNHKTIVENYEKELELEKAQLDLQS